MPAVSLSGTTTTSRPAKKGVSSGGHLRDRLRLSPAAPPALHVAIRPRLAARSASFSPSTNHTTASRLASISGSRYGTRRTSLVDQSQPPLPFGRRWRKSFGSLRTTWKSSSPVVIFGNDIEGSAGRDLVIAQPLQRIFTF